MFRRLHVSQVIVGRTRLEAREAHHIRDVLRLSAGAPIELFDDGGYVGAGSLIVVNSSEVIASIESITLPGLDAFRLVIAAAVPKAGRADWMIEKLSELGADTFVPLATERSVVLPEGKNKIERWERLAAEASKQSRRAGVMSIERLTPLDIAMEQALLNGDALHLSTDAAAEPLRNRLEFISRDRLTVFIGPEGGWSPLEAESFARLGVTGASLGLNILRVETAAIAATAAIKAILFNRPPSL